MSSAWLRRQAPLPARTPGIFGNTTPNGHQIGGANGHQMVRERQGMPKAFHLMVHRPYFGIVIGWYVMAPTLCFIWSLQCSGGAATNELEPRSSASFLQREMLWIVFMVFRTSLTRCGGIGKLSLACKHLDSKCCPRTRLQTAGLFLIPKESATLA